MTDIPDKVAIVAGAGTGKSSLLREFALSHPDEGILYLTYTEGNATSFEEGVREAAGTVPTNVTIMTWFSFLLVHGVRPFPLAVIPERVDSCYLQSGRIRARRGVHKGDHDYYCKEDGCAYTGRLSELALACDKQWGGAVFDRIAGAFTAVLIDEAQDFSGADYDVIAKLIAASRFSIVVGDPRQSTYRTGNEPLYKGRYRDLFDYLGRNKVCRVDGKKMTVSHRCPEEVISLANALYRGIYPEVRSEDPRTDKKRAFLLKKNQVCDYAKTRDCIALTYDGRTKVAPGLRRMNMGASKGMTFPHVIIYASGDMKKWLKGSTIEWKPITRAKFYVAITRASESVAFVVD